MLLVKQYNKNIKFVTLGIIISLPSICFIRKNEQALATDEDHIFI